MADSESDLEFLRTRLQLGGGLPPHHGYDPNQPRVSAGHRDGGQWTKTPGSGSPAAPRREAIVDRSGREAWGSYANTYRSDGTLAEQRVFNRDGSRIVTEFNVAGSPGGWDERHTVAFRDGSKVTFQNSGDVQAILDGEGRLISAAVWTKDGAEAPPTAQLAFAGDSPLYRLLARVAPPPLVVAIAAALALYTWLSSRKDRDRTPVIALPAKVYRPGTAEESEPVMVTSLTEAELEKACPNYPTVQSMTDKAAVEARVDRTDWSPSGFGTEVHKRVARAVNGVNRVTGEFRSPNNPQDPNFVAEFSALKTKAADPNAPNARYGQKGTIRVDVLENRPAEDTVCVYDIKTGEAVLTLPRIAEILGSIHKHFANVRRFIVTEVRPRP